MQRLYIWIIIAAIVFAASYSKTIKDFFIPSEKTREAVPSEPSKGDDSYEQLGVDLYRMASTFSNLQGKVELLKMAKEKKEWFRQEDYASLDALMETTQKDLSEAEKEFLKAKEDYTKITVQRMLEDYSRGQQK